MIKKKLHKVPYYSQRSSHEWEKRGFKSLKEAMDWEKRSCGIACIKMVLDLHGEHEGQRFAELIQEMAEKGVYKEGIGCVHQGIVDEFNRREIDSQRMKIDSATEIKNFIDQGNILIVSIGPGFVEGKKSGHLVPVIGYTEENGEIKSLIVNHTSTLEDRQWPEREIEVDRFMNHFSGNAIRVRLYT